MSDEVLEVGKLPPDLLAEVLVTGRPVPPELLLPPTVGEDAGVVAVQAGALIAASDPVTLTGQDVGAHAVLVNANDIAVMGARPRWFTATVLLPPGITADEVRALYRRMHEALADLDAVLVGGHVEITDAVRRTVVSGHMMGLRQDGNFARTAALELGHVVVQIGPAPVEGAAVLAAEARAQLEGKVAAATLAEAAGALSEPGISVVDAALRATVLGATAMHDPTEGGLSAGLYEMAETAGIGAHGLGRCRALVRARPRARRSARHRSLGAARLRCPARGLPRRQRRRGACDAHRRRLRLRTHRPRRNWKRRQLRVRRCGAPLLPRRDGPRLQRRSLERVRLWRTRDRPRPRPAAYAAPSRRRRPQAGCRERQ